MVAKARKGVVHKGAKGKAAPKRVVNAKRKTNVVSGAKLMQEFYAASAGAKANGAHVLMGSLQDVVRAMAMTMAYDHHIPVNEIIDSLQVALVEFATTARKTFGVIPEIAEDVAKVLDRAGEDVHRQLTMLAFAIRNDPAAPGATKRKADA